MKTRPFLAFSVLSLILLGGTAQRARADFTISVGNTGPLGVGTIVGPYAHVAFSQPGGVGPITVTITAAAPNVNGQYFVFNTEIGLNLAAGVSIVPGSVGGAVSPFGTPLPSIVNSQSPQIDGFDKFNTYLNGAKGSGGGMNGFTQLQFQLTGANLIGNGSNLFTPNSGSGTTYFIAMHINVYAGPPGPGQTVVLTGFGANGPEGTPQVPAPQIAVLLASGGFCALGGFAFRRRWAK